MPFATCQVDFQESLLSRLARDLLDILPNAAQGDLSDALVILPSARACRTLGHVLLEESGRQALLLPRSVTPAQLLQEEAAALGLDRDSLPDDTTCPLVLAHLLEKLPWLSERPENAPGLAREFLAFFNEARLHGRADLLAGEAALEKVLSAGSPGEAEVLASDVRRLGEVWRLYRQTVPRDRIDLLLETAESAAARPRPPLELVAVAGFSRLDPPTAALIRAQAAGAGKARLYLPAAGSLLARFFTATWPPDSRKAEGRGLDPLAPGLLAGRQLVPEGELAEPGLQVPSAGTLRERLDELGDLTGLWSPGGPLELAACPDQERESLLIADRVVRIMQETEGRQSVAVVTNDPVLAARITAQLRDTGIDVDDTLGSPLAALPAGLLLRFILRTAVSGLRADSLLEVLTHPDTGLGRDQGRREILNLNLERMVRRHEAVPAGPAELLDLARRRDEAAGRVAGAPVDEMTGFVQATVEAFAPLLDLARGEHPVSRHVEALRRAWAALAADLPLAEDPARADVTAADRILATLETDREWLPPLSLSAFAADLNRLLGAVNVAPHRSEGLPVLVAGLVEARLERYDHLVIAGMNEGKFPSRHRRPLFLNASVREKLGLPVWRESLARDAELFLRLLHNAPRVLVTWSQLEGAGRPLLPSPLVERLRVGRPAGEKITTAAPVPRWRRQPVPAGEIDRRQEIFDAESMDIRKQAECRPRRRLSWSALRTWRECPYRFLLERGFVLRKEDEIREEFGKRDSGSIIHAILRRWLEPESPGHAALADGRNHSVVEAGEILEEIAEREFLDGGASRSARSLWLETFRVWIGDILDYERERFRTWRPLLLEAGFELPLPGLVDWIVEAAEREADSGEPPRDLPVLEPGHRDILLTGTIDRVDRRLEGTGDICSVIDYKTGRVPTNPDVATLKDMQLLLYALALENGTVTGAPGPEARVVEAFYYAVGAKGFGLISKKGPPFQGDRKLLLDAACELVATAVQAADGRDFPLLAGKGSGLPSQLPCRYCDFRGLCRLEERKDLPPVLLSRLEKMITVSERGTF